MAINISDGQYATVWEVEDRGTFSMVRMGTSRKDKRDGSYKNSNWSFVRFVGAAHEKAKAGIPERTRIHIHGGIISWEPYIDSVGAKVYPKNPQLTIFNFEIVKNEEATASSNSMDTPPSNFEDDENLPF